MKSNVLLITSSFEKVSLMDASLKHPSGIKSTEDSHYPLGLAYLHSYLESCGNNIRSLYLNHCSYKKCFETINRAIEEFSPVIIGLQMFSANRSSNYRLIEHINKKYPNIHLVLGGIHSTIMYKQLLETYPFLTIVIGEGEITFSELVKEFRKENFDLKSIDGIAFNYNGSVIKTGHRKLIDNLDILPFPKHDLFFDDKRTSGCLLTSRGCPFNCSFCALRAISERTVRYRSPKNVVDEIEYMVNKFPKMTQLWIHDDSFFLDNQRVIEICDDIIRRKIKMRFLCSGRAKPLSKEMVDKLENANFKKVLLGLESGNEKILQSCHKAISQEDVLNAFRLFSGSSIGIYAFLIIGLPGETLETIMETINFVKKLQRIKYIYYRNTSIPILSIYPGTEVYEIARAKNLINDDFWLSDKPVPLFAVEHNQEHLIKFKEIMLNHISLDRFWTKVGFKAQFTMIPYIIKYLFISGEITGVLIRLLKFIFPKKIYELLKSKYRILFSK
ncbi:MAG: radical SAM protein, partial [Patescibacteria group bacterium]